MPRLIDADALIVEIKTCLWDWESVNGIMAKTVLNQTITDIGNMPTIDAVPVKHGKWVVVPDEVFADSYFCSVCRNEPIVDLYGEYCLSNYCPNCGAKMDKEMCNE